MKKACLIMYQKDNQLYRYWHISGGKPVSIDKYDTLDMMNLIHNRITRELEILYNKIPLLKHP